MSMSPFEYHRPKTLDEALELLQRGVPLAGGTALTPKRRQVPAVIDLQELGLDGLELGQEVVSAGAAIKLQRLVEAGNSLPAALIGACHLEASPNLRNMATLGGTIMSCDGRSPLVTALLALDAELQLEPGNQRLSLEALLDQRAKSKKTRLITKVQFKMPLEMGYDQVSRSPADFPLVCLAVAKQPMGKKGFAIKIAVGGHGGHPIRLKQAEKALDSGASAEQAAEEAGKAYASAGDQWASREYRAHVATVLTRRLLTEVSS
jgi:probable selenate reductase FAD-binding subunit